MGVVMTRAEMVRGLEPLTAFDVQGVRSLVEEYEELCPTPALWERAFVELLNCFSSDEAGARAFGVLDTDSNGLVDGREVLGALAILCKGHLVDRLRLLYDIFDLGKAKEMQFDGCFMMLKRTMAGMRKMVAIIMPPERVIHNMTKQVWKLARKHRQTCIVYEDWFNWWSSDAMVRSALKMVTWKPEEQRGLPTPDQQLSIDYTKGSGDDDTRGRVGSFGNNRPSSRSPSRGPEALHSPSAAGGGGGAAGVKLGPTLVVPPGPGKF